MAAKHTPGPWVRDRASGLNCDVRGGNGRKVALCWGLSATAAAKNSDAYRAECDANAVLIAAAPDLLAALQELCALEADGMQAAESAIESWERARAAIAKATGATQ